MNDYDSKEVYCRKLGHHLTFQYCRLVNEQLPCHKIADCWFEHIPIQNFLKTHYNEEEIERIFAPPENKMSSLLSLIEKAQNRG
jgi:hypothetical protein